MVKVLVHRRDDRGMGLEPFASRPASWTGETGSGSVNRPAGTVLGVDAGHSPNHHDVLIATADTPTGTEPGPRPGTAVRFRPAAAGAGRPRRSE